MKKTLKTGWECPENDNEGSCVSNDPKLSKYRENYSQNMKKSSETEKTHTFFLKIGEEMMQKWSLRSV